MTRRYPPRPIIETCEPRMLLSGAWVDDTLVTGELSGTFTSIILDAQGRPQVSWYNESAGDLMYGYLDGSWKIDTLDSSDDTGLYTSLAADITGRVHLSYYNATTGDLMYRQRMADFWTITDLVASTGDVGRFSSIAVDRLNQPHIVFYNDTTDTLQYTYMLGATWQTPETIATLGQVDVASVHKLAGLGIDASNHVYVSFYDPAGGDLMCAVRTGPGAWNVTAVHTSGDAGRDNSLAIDDAQGRPHISYYVDVGGRSTLNHAWYNGSAWVIETVHDVAATYLGMHNSIAISDTGRIGISYGDQTNSRLLFARYNGTSWVRNTINELATQGVYSDVAFDEFGAAYVSYTVVRPTYHRVTMSTMTEMDLGLELGQPSATDLQSQDSFTIPLIITNEGGRPFSGQVPLFLFASSNIFSDGDPVVANKIYSVALEVGQSVEYALSARIPSNLASGTYYLLGEMSVYDTGDDNNLALSGQMIQVTQVNLPIATFGTIDGQQVKSQLTGSNQTLVTFSLTGGGWAEIYGEGTFDDIVLHSTTAGSVLKISTPRGTQASVGAISVEGPLSMLSAGTTVLRGDLTVREGVKKLLLDDLAGGNTILLNSQGALYSTLKLSVTIDQAGNGVDFTSNKLPILSLTANQWGGAASSITAPSLGKLSVRGGDAAGKLTLTGDSSRYVLGSAVIKGDLLDADWDLTGSTGTIKVYGDVSGDIQASGAIRSVTAWRWSDGSLAADSLGSLKVTGSRTGTVGDFAADLTLLGHDVLAGRKTFSSVKVAHNVGTGAPLAWSIAGIGGAVSIKEQASQLTLDTLGSLRTFKAALLSDVDIEVDGLLGSLQAVQWTGGSLQAGSAGTIKINGNPRAAVEGNLVGVRVTLSGQGVAAGKRALTKLYVRDKAQDSTVRVSGHAGTVDVGWLDTSRVLLGAANLTGNASDFGANQFRLASLKVRGCGDAGPMRYFDGSDVGAWEIGSLRIGNSSPSGLSGMLQYHQVGRSYYVPNALDTQMYVEIV